MERRNYSRKFVGVDWRRLTANRKLECVGMGRNYSYTGLIVADDYDDDLSDSHLGSKKDVGI